MGIHAGVNQNFLEILDQDEDQSLFMGIDLEFNPELSLLVEYNAALSENDMKAEDIDINRGGYLNAAVRWTFVERLHIEMDFNNLLFNEDKVDYFNRELKIIYIEYF
jgi:GH35 family endo-1,4-beta-xylanase